MAGVQIYVAVLVSESHVAGDEPLFQESFVLVHAAGEDEARAKAEALGRAGETSYENADGRTVTWTLRHVVDVAPVLRDDLGDGADLYTRHFRDIEAYEAFEPLLSGEEL
ncbi:DUF4288 domain-containing protein [Yinghuangia sp. YIM S09857]|uniref:DUF4288 domain-containing protein n=1 Tax=Yinghuangia sp. YIM S09857 TaxID=3436929 RepID=UPI003F5353E9